MSIYVSTEYTQAHISLYYESQHNDEIGIATQSSQRSHHARVVTSRQYKPPQNYEPCKYDAVDPTPIGSCLAVDLKSAERSPTVDVTFNSFLRKKT